MSNPLDNPKLEQAVNNSNGQLFHGNLVTMTIDMFKRAVGIETEEQFDRSVAELNERLAQCDRGETKTQEEFWSEFRQQNGI